MHSKYIQHARVWVWVQVLQEIGLGMYCTSNFDIFIFHRPYTYSSEKESSDKPRSLLSWVVQICLYILLRLIDELISN